MPRQTGAPAADPCGVPAAGELRGFKSVCKRMRRAFRAKAGFVLRGPKTKLAELPEPVQEELNRRLFDGQQGPQILAWLNGLIAEDAELRERLQGRRLGDARFTAQNLSNWRLAESYPPLRAEGGTGFAECQRGRFVLPAAVGGKSENSRTRGTFACRVSSFIPPR